MFYTSRKLDDPPRGRFWTLNQDGNVYPEMPLGPSATGFGWLDGRHKPFLDEGDSLDHGDSVGDSLLDAWVECVLKGIWQVIVIRNSLTRCPSWFTLPGLDGLHQALVPPCGAANV